MIGLAPESGLILPTYGYIAFKKRLARMAVNSLYSGLLRRYKQDQELYDRYDYAIDAFNEQIHDPNADKHVRDAMGFPTSYDDFDRANVCIVCVLHNHHPRMSTLAPFKQPLRRLKAESSATHMRMMEKAIGVPEGTLVHTATDPSDLITEIESYFTLENWKYPMDNMPAGLEIIPVTAYVDTVNQRLSVLIQQTLNNPTGRYMIAPELRQARQALKDAEARLSRLESLVDVYY